MYVYTGYGLCLGLCTKSLHSNSAYEATLEATLFQELPRGSGQGQQPERIFDLEFKPFFRTDKQVVWIGDSKSHVYQNNELAAHLIHELVNELQKRSEHD